MTSVRRTNNKPSHASRKAASPKPARGAKASGSPAPQSVHLQPVTIGTSHSTDEVEQLVQQWCSLPEVAVLLEVPVTRVRHLLAERHLVALRRGRNSALFVPALLLRDGQPVRGLPGLLTVLVDAGFDELETVQWLFRPEPSLGGTPVEALRQNRIAPVRRAAQSSAW